MDIYQFLILGHIIGTVLGVGGATMIEAHLGAALRDGKMDDTEKAFMAKNFLVTRIGMVLAILTGIGFVAIYIINGATHRLTDGMFWAKMSVVMIIVVNAILLHKHKIGLYWGSAFSFVSWWAALLMGFFLTNGVKFLASDPLVSYIMIMAIYAFAVLCGAYILHFFREHGKIVTTTQNT